MTNIIEFWTNIPVICVHIHVHALPAHIPPLGRWQRLFRKKWDDIRLERQDGQSLATDKNQAIYRVIVCPTHYLFVLV